MKDLKVLYTCTAQIASAKGPSAQQGSRPRGDAALRQPRAHTSQGASGGQRLRRCACPAPLGALNFFELGPATVTHEVPALVQGPRMAAEHGDGGRGAQPDRRVRSPRNPGATALIRSSPDRKRQPLQRACTGTHLQYERGSADLYVFGSPKNTEGYQFSKTFFGVIFANNPN